MEELPTPIERTEHSDHSFITKKHELRNFSDLETDKEAYQTWANELDIRVDGPFLEDISSSTFNKLYCYHIVVRDKKELFSKSIRRFNDFLWTEIALEFEFLGRIIPSTPEKNALVKAGLADSNFLELRRKKLEHFVKSIVKLPDICFTKTVKNFIFEPRELFAVYQEEHTKTIIDVSEKSTTSLMGYFENFWSKTESFRSL